MIEVALRGAARGLSLAWWGWAFREAFHSRYSLAPAAIFSVAGFDLIANHRFIAGVIVVMLGALMLACWIVTLPDRSALTRFWLLVFVFIGSVGYLLQNYDDEEKYRRSLTAGVLIPVGEKDPQISCGSLAAESDLAVKIGSDAVIVHDFPHVVLWFRHLPVIMVDRKPEGVSVSLVIYDENGDMVFRAIDNMRQMNTDTMVSFVRPNYSTTIVNDKKGHDLMRLHLNSPRFLTISGMMLYSDDPVVISGLSAYFGHGNAESGGCTEGSIGFDGGGGFVLR
jgi:hypothetical protein